MQRSGFVDFAKGVLITLVTIGHTIQFIVYRNTDFWNDPLFKAIYMFHMPLFMAIAGYLFSRSIRNTNNNGLPEYLGRRSLSYLLPIISWATLFQVALFAFTSRTTLQQLPLAIVHEAFISQWFLWALLGAIIVTSLSTLAGRHSYLVIAILFCGILALPDKGNIHLFKYTFPFFLAGYLSPNYSSALKKASKSFALLAIGFLTMCVGFFLWNDQTYIYVTKMDLVGTNVHNIVLRWVFGAVGSLVVLAILQRMYSLLPGKWAWPVELAGKDSLYIYILQSYVILVLSKLLYIGHYGVFIQTLLALVLGISITLACWGGGSLIASNKYTARILFGKTKRQNLSVQQVAFGGR